MLLKHFCRKAVIVGGLIILIIKLIIRPFQVLPDGEFFWGIAPNLISSFLVPFFAYWFCIGKNNWLARTFKIQTIYDLRIVSLKGLALIMVNEYLQLIPVFGRTFDLNDLLSSFAGIGISYFVFRKLQQRYAWQTA